MLSFVMQRRLERMFVHRNTAVLDRWLAKAYADFTMIAKKTRYWLDSRPASDPLTCGDFAACFTLEAERYAIIIGDVAGRGPAAGVAATALLSYTIETLTTGRPLHAALDRIDHYFTDSVKSDTVAIASLFLAVANDTDAVLDYASAGHEPVLHFTSQTRHDHLHPTGPVLGLGGLSSAQCSQRRVAMFPESLLVLVTDGVTEARRYVGGEPQFFGSSGVTRAVVAARRSQRDPARTINEAALAHSGVLRDDATALVVGLQRTVTAPVRRPPTSATRDRHRATVPDSYG